MRKYDNQKGRSMIEMLGVLAIVGVLSVAGIAGYSKAMGKYKINKLMDQVSTIAANVKTMFAATGSYGDLADTATARSLGLLPEEMTRTASNVNALNGSVTVAPTTDGLAFAIIMDGLTRDACAAVVSSEWGGASGIRYVQVADKDLAAPANGNVPSSGNIVTPASTQEAMFAAAESCADGYEVMWIFY